MTRLVPDHGCAADPVFERAAAARLTRATLVKRTAALAGGAAALAALEPISALGAVKDGDPQPIPGGFAPDFSPVPGDPFIHVLPPVMSFEMSTITDFDGVVAAGEIQGTAHDNQGGSYWFDCDMRFMKGRYVDLNGRKQQGVFGFVWIDLFQGPRGDFNNSTQLHDFEPGIQPSGLFWTIPIPASSVNLQQEKGGARFRMVDLPIGDYGDFGHATSSLPPDPSPSSIPSLVSFDVVWQGGGDSGSFHDSDFGFTGDFRTGDATISFRARNIGSNVEYRSDPDDQSTAGPPGVGTEKNGIYFT